MFSYRSAFVSTSLFCTSSGSKLTSGNSILYNYVLKGNLKNTFFTSEINFFTKGYSVLLASAILLEKTSDVKKVGGRSFFSHMEFFVLGISKLQSVAEWLKF